MLPMPKSDEPKIETCRQQAFRGQLRKVTELRLWLDDQQEPARNPTLAPLVTVMMANIITATPFSCRKLRPEFAMSSHTQRHP
jgi:hypothetical protein